MPPSLLVPGKLIPRPNATPKEIAELSKIKPITYIINKVKSKLHDFGAPVPKTMDDCVLIVRAKTGSGKSTAMPVELYRLFQPKVLRPGDKEETIVTSLHGTWGRGQNILCTQPRVLTAMDIPKELSNPVQSPWASDMILGDTIGYSTGTKKAPCKNCLLYATLDTLLAQLRSNTDDEIKKLYRMIILDEVHERSVTLDMVIMMVKAFLLRNLNTPDCPFVIFTSATFDVEKYAQYLGVNPLTNIIDIEGAVYATEDIYLQTDTSNYIDTAVEIVSKINKENKTPQGKGDILVFLPGMAWDKKFLEKLKIVFEEGIALDRTYITVEVNSQTVNSLKVFEYLNNDYADLRTDEAGKPDKNGKFVPYRRILHGTTVAETGVTFPNLGYVIEPGWTQQPETFYPYNITGVFARPVARSRAMQRRGRVGRKFDGTAYFLYTKEVFDAMVPIQLADVILTGLKKELLAIIDIQPDLTKIDMLDTPTVDNLKYALTAANTTGTINPYTMELTPIGKLLSNTRSLTFESFALIKSAYAYGVALTDIATIIVMNQWRRPREGKWQPKTVLEISLPKFFEGDLDVFFTLTLDKFIENIFIFNAITTQLLTTSIKKTREWLDKVGLGGLETYLKLAGERATILDDIITLEFKPFFHEDKELSKITIGEYLPRVKAIKRCLYDAYRLNVIQFDRSVFYYTNRFGSKIQNVRGIPRDIQKYCNTLICSEIRFRGSGDNLKQDLAASDNWSVLDGYVPIDEGFLEPNI